MAATKGDRTRQALLAAAVRRFADDGYKAVALADVARDVGVTPAAVYAYFPGKEALFRAAVDADAADLVERGLAVLQGDGAAVPWPTLIPILVGALPEHPLARRVLAGLEPESTGRLLDIPALAHLREALAALLAAQQEAGRVRSDIDPAVMADGLETIVLALLLAIVQIGGARPERTAGVLALLQAALQGEHQPADRG